tara:strand:- start:126 stop:332 length:207 start_codon:yes stop_codon:yes gene_type:complete
MNIDKIYKKDVSKCFLTKKNGGYSIKELRKIAKIMGIITIKREEICEIIQKLYKCPCPLIHIKASKSI